MFDRGTAGKAFGSGIRYLQFDYIIWAGVGATAISEAGWVSELNTKQQVALWVLNGIGLGFVGITAALAAYAYLSFYMTTFSVSPSAMGLLRLFSKSPQYVGFLIRTRFMVDWHFLHAFSPRFLSCH